MSTDLTLMGDSPFDAIRRVKPNGTEYWSARDLMPLLGYERYENFVQSVNRAWDASCNTDGVEAAGDHFRDATKMVPLGSGAERAVGDRHLTRYACYLVAMNGDPRKAEIAAAQSYFAIKTREAETAKPVVVAEISRRELAAMVIAEADRADAAEAKARDLAPAAAAWTQLADANGDFSVADAAKILSRDPAIETGERRLFASLNDLGWIYRGRGDGKWRCRQSAVDARRVRSRAQAHLDVSSGERVVDVPQVRVTVKGLHDLHRMLGGSGPLLIEVAS